MRYQNHMDKHQCLHLIQQMFHHYRFWQIPKSVVCSSRSRGLDLLASTLVLTTDSFWASGLTYRDLPPQIESQLSNRQRLEFADVKIDNSEDEDRLRSRVEYHWKRLLKRIAAPAS